MWSDRGNIGTVPVYAPGFAAGDDSIQMLKWSGVHKVEFQSHGVKSHARKFTILRAHSEGEFIMMADFHNGAGPQRFSGSFTLQPGAKVTLSSQDGEEFDLRSFYEDKFEFVA